ncbi:MetQ/NlpA family ABC transporter substrate-binding protein [Paraeggerthella sp. Marseille-Q4926]|uniref:MetQ/NlpA family ABC transporter substrate-binding protein n=1 Tax=Paraeggerthella sp. Marseille-Q4926 TaxID=2866587 RepID=UPI001CE3E584|nr:MetQ/NlpA family ABC transporter substrate-binding protein [Paraeggerthella sp. Marseille-Q4926]
MKCKLVALLSIVASLCAALVLFSGCSAPGTDDSGAKSLKVGVVAGPYQDLFREAVEPSLRERGYSVSYVEFSDYVQPNNALVNGDISLNVFQHSTYLNSFAQQHGLDLAALAEIPTAAMGVFSNKVGSLDQLSEGATVAVPNDDTNLSRSLRVLQQAGLVFLDSAVDPAKATVDDIASNPKNIVIKQVNAEILPTVLDSVDAAVVNGNYAIGAGLDLADAAYVEQLSEGYYNVIAVRGEDAAAPFAQDIVAIVGSDAFRRAIEDPSRPFSAFSRPSGY